MKKILTLTALAAATSFASAQQVFTQTLTFGPDLLNFDETLNFNQVNVNASDIQGVSWTYSLTTSGGQFILDNDSNQNATGTAIFGAILDVDSPSLNLLDENFNAIFDDVSSSAGSVFNLAPNQGDGANDYDPTGPDGMLIQGSTVTETGGGNVNANFWSQYAGSGTVPLVIDADTLASFSGSGGIETATTPPSAYGSITLQITAVPEPSTSMMGLLAALGLVARRKR